MHSYRRVFLLFPPKFDFNVDFYAQVKQWLDADGIEHPDFARLLLEGGYKVEDRYWKLNGHWHENGNRIVGRLLSTRY